MATSVISVTTTTHTTPLPDYTNDTNDTYDLLVSYIRSLVLKTTEIKLKNGDTIYCAYKRQLSNPKRLDEILRYIRYFQPDTSMKCKTCIDFIRKYAAYVFVGDKTLFGSLPNSNKIFNLLHEIDSLYTSSKEIVIVDGPIGTRECGGFNHIYIDLPKCVSEKFTTDDYQWFIHQHYPTLNRLMKENNNDGIIPSLELLLTLLPKITYGDKIQESTEWFLKYMKNYMSPDYDCNIVVLDALVNQYMVKGYAEERIVTTNLKQTKDTVLRAMSCAHSESALVSLLTNLFNPTTYMRKTAPPTQGQLEVAMNIFKDAGFYTTVMTLTNLLNKYNGREPSSVIISSKDDAFSTWGSMQTSMKNASIKGRRGGAGGFAHRAGTTAFDAPTTITKLYSRINEMPGLTIHVTSSSHPVMLTQFPDTARDLLKHDYLWGFKNGKTPHSEYGIMSGYHPVSAMTAPGTMGRNVAFIIKGASIRDKHNVGNTCFPSFLKEAVQRKAGSAFESLNKTTTARLPDSDEPLALGVGSSRSDSHNHLYTSLSFKYKDHTFTISKWE